MRRFFVLFCTLALACAGYAAREEHKPEPKKKGARPAQHSEHKPEPKKKETRPAEHSAARERRPANLNRPGAKPMKPVTQSTPRPHRLTPSTKPLKASDAISCVRFQPPKQAESENPVCEISEKQTNCGKPILARSKLLGIPELQIGVAR